jgi:tetratricopeptide (TPR) repeat protein
LLHEDDGGPLDRDPPRSDPRAHPRPTWTEEVWVFDGLAGDEAERSSRPGRARAGRNPVGSYIPTRSDTTGRRLPPTSGKAGEGLPAEVVDEITGAVGRSKSTRVVDRLAAAARAYERDRYPEAFRITRVLAGEVPESAAARELHGLVCYRLGRWREAVKHLEAARTLSGGDPSQLPVLMDCHRAMGHRRRVEVLWKELRAASPSADVLVEGRLVLAENLAEEGKLDEAIAVLATAGGARNLRNPGARHVRQWYVLADLYERAGDVPRARELFARVAGVDPELADATERLRALGSPRRRPRRGSGSARR